MTEHYIRCSPNNHYQPGESLKNLFEALIVRPFEHDLPVLSEAVKNNRIYYWEDIARILKQGQSNFDEVSFDKPSNEYYFPKDKVSIYCVHHMPRHLFGSYHVFTKSSINDKNKVVFIDFGCGPLTSGIAFHAFAGQRDITYLGIDSSRTMLNKAVTINKYGPNKYKEPFFDKFALIHDYSYDGLRKLLGKYIENGDGTQLIFNFCYFFSSPTLDVNNLCDVLIQIMKEHSQHKVCFIYQNPAHQSLSGARRLKLYGKWEKLKTRLSMFRSQVTESNVETFSYCRLINGLRHNSTVYYEVLCYA